MLPLYARFGVITKNSLFFQSMIPLRNHPRRGNHETKLFRGSFYVVYLKGSAFEGADFAGGRLFRSLFWQRRAIPKTRRSHFFRRFGRQPTKRRGRGETLFFLGGHFTSSGGFPFSLQKPLLTAVWRFPGNQKIPKVQKKKCQQKRVLFNRFWKFKFR